MKSSIIAWFLAIVFFMTSLIFGGLYFSERHSFQNAKTAFGRLQAEISQSENQASQESAQNSISAICGIYDCKTVYSHNQIDLRSDFTAIYFVNTSSGMVPQPKTNWKMNSDGTISVGVNTTFKIEQDDLIDSKGNRWLHVR